jgi:hypothetical protein
VYSALVITYPNHRHTLQWKLVRIDRLLFGTEGKSSITPWVVRAALTSSATAVRGIDPSQTAFISSVAMRAKRFLICLIVTDPLVIKR